MAQYTQRFPGTAANDNSAGTTAWTSTKNGIISGGAYTPVTIAAGVSSQYYKCTNFAFDQGPDPVPSDATIAGVEAIIQMHQDTGDTHNNTAVAEIKLVKGGTIGGTSRHDSRAIYKQTANIMDFGTRTGTYNVALDLWGNTLTAADVRASDFGVAIRVTNSDGSANATINIQVVQLRVYWTKAAAVVLRPNTPSLMAPCLIACDCIQSTVGDRDPAKCEFRWYVEGPNGWDPTQTDPRPGTGVNGETRHEATSKRGFYASWRATVAGTYTVRCRMYGDGDPNTMLAEDTETFVVAADSRTVRYIDPSGGNNGNAGTSMGAAWQTLAGACTNAASGGTVTNYKFIYKTGTTQTLSNVDITENISNLWITTESGTPVIWNCTGTGGGVYFSGTISDLYIERVYPVGDHAQAGTPQKCIAFGTGVTRNVTIDYADTGCTTPCVAVQGGTAGADADCRYVHINKLRDSTDDAVATYGFYADSCAFFENVGYSMDALASGNGNGHARTAGPVTQAQQITTWRGLGWYFRWCDGDCTGSSLAGFRLPIWYSGVQECVTTQCTMSFEPDPAAGSLFAAYCNRVEGLYNNDDVSSVQTGHHYVVVNSVFAAVGGSGAIQVGRFCDQAHFLNCNFYDPTASSFESVLRQYQFADTNTFNAQAFFENCLTYSTTPGGSAYWYSDRSWAVTQTVRLAGHFKNCAWPVKAGNAFGWWNTSTKDGPFSGGATNWSDEAFVINNVDESANSTTVPSSTAYQPDAALTEIRGGGIAVDGVYEDYSGTLRNPDAAAWYIGVRSADTISYHSEAADSTPTPTPQSGGRGRMGTRYRDRYLSR